MSPGELIAILGGTGAFGAAVLALIGVIIANSVTRKLKERELFQSALESFLAGGTQKRTTGIAILREYAASQNMKEVATTIFLGHMLHLQDLKHDASDSDRKIETFNYNLMKDAVEKWRSSVSPSILKQAEGLLDQAGRK